MSLSQFSVEQRDREQRSRQRLLIFSIFSSLLFHGGLLSLIEWDVNSKQSSKEKEEPIESIVLEKPKPKTQPKSQQQLKSSQQSSASSSSSSSSSSQPQPKPKSPPQTTSQPELEPTPNPKPKSEPKMQGESQPKVETETNCLNFWVNPNTGKKECLNHTISSNTQGKKIVFVENPNGKQSYVVTKTAGLLKVGEKATVSVNVEARGSATDNITYGVLGTDEGETLAVKKMGSLGSGYIRIKTEVLAKAEGNDLFFEARPVYNEKQAIEGFNPPEEEAALVGRVR